MAVVDTERCWPRCSPAGTDSVVVDLPDGDRGLIRATEKFDYTSTLDEIGQVYGVTRAHSPDRVQAHVKVAPPQPFSGPA